MSKRWLLLRLTILTILLISLSTPYALTANADILNYFSKTSGSYYIDGTDNLIIDDINQAQTSIKMAMYDLTNKNITQALIDAHSRGVLVEVVTDDAKVGDTKYTELKQAGIRLEDDQDKKALMHNKILIIDEKVTWIGSANYTVYSFYRNNENLLRINDATLSKIYLDKVNKLLSHDATPSASLKTEQVEIYFSPEHDIENRLIELINEATHSIKFLAFAFTNPEISDALIAAHIRGVKILGVFDEGQNSFQSYSKYQTLLAVGISVYLDANKQKLHDKVFVFDNKIMVSGSYNFTSKANDSNDENILVLHDPSMAQQYSNEFDSICQLANNGNHCESRDASIGALSWPLCGRISENPPENWQPKDNCPQVRVGATEFSDFPLSSSFGPRQLVSENKRYDFHRGLDIPTPTGTPIFAVTDGTVYKAGENVSGYSDPMIMLRHFRAGSTATNCGESGGCFHSVYLHLSSVKVKAGDTLSQGDLIGYSGQSVSGFEHLHFEIREAKAKDPYSSWQRDAIHPLKYLPYSHPVKRDIGITIASVSQTNTTLKVAANIEVPIEALDLLRLEIIVYKKQSDGNLTLIPQTTNTANANGYYITPAWFDMEIWNYQYTHKDSTNFPWTSFGEGGENECPYYANHPSEYSAHNHLDQAVEGSPKIGDFNGLLIAQQHYNATSDASIAQYTFQHIKAAETLSNSCIHLKAVDVQGNETLKTYNCSLAMNQGIIAIINFLLL